MRADPAAPRCAEHPEAPAGWRCGGCGLDRCPDCVTPRRVAATTVAICRACGGLATPLTRPRQLVPYWAMLPELVGGIFSPQGLLQLFAVGLALAVSGALPWPVRSFTWIFIFTSYYLHVVNHAAQGGVRLPEPADFSGVESVVQVALRFWVLTALLWAPGALYVSARIGWGRVWREGPELLLDPGLYGVVALGLLYLPVAIIAAAVSNSALAALNPLITVRVILRFPGQYLLTAALWYVLAGVQALWALGLQALVAGSTVVWLLSGLFVEGAGLIFPALQALILGRFIYQNAHDFGILLRGQDVEPLLPGVAPRGAPLLETQSKRASRVPEALEIEGWTPEGSSPDRGTFEHGALLRFGEEATRAGDEALAAALAAHDAEAVLRLAETGQISAAPQLPAGAELELAIILERAGRYDAAAEACRRGAQAGAGTPDGARALFMQGRLHLERRRDPAAARAAWSALVAEYPGEPLADEARTRLAAFR